MFGAGTPLSLLGGIGGEVGVPGLGKFLANPQDSAPWHQRFDEHGNLAFRHKSCSKSGCGYTQSADNETAYEEIWRANLSEGGTGTIDKFLDPANWRRAGIVGPILPVGPISNWKYSTCKYCCKWVPPELFRSTSPLTGCYISCCNVTLAIIANRVCDDRRGGYWIRGNGGQLQCGRDGYDYCDGTVAYSGTLKCYVDALQQRCAQISPDNPSGCSKSPTCYCPPSTRSQCEETTSHYPTTKC